VGDKPTELVYEKTLPDKTDDNGFVEKLWGTRKIAYLLDQIRRSGETKETKDEVVSLAKKYGIVTPYTSYLVAEDKDMQPERPMRAGLPTGSMRRPESPGFSDRFSRQSASNTTVEPRPARAMDMAGSGAAQAPASYALKSAPTESGEKAVEYSQSIRKMKEAKAESEVGGFAGTRNASGKTFRLDGGVWIDSRLETNEVATLKVKYLSQAYFDILKKFPELKEVFALGTEFRVKLSNGVLEISSQGIETIEPARLNELKP